MSEALLAPSTTKHYKTVMRAIRLLSKACILLTISIAWQNDARGCAALSEKGLVGVNHEDVVTIWDRPHKMEHFIRSVALNTSAKNAGFLVPTPTTPEIATADMRIFNLPENYFRRYKGLSRGSESNSDGIEPRVILEQDIGDYHAVVLDATDSKGLGDWLKGNGYSWTDSSAKWLEPYLAGKWKITAFKLRRASGGTVSAIHTSAIRLSFTTNRPFFPYREPPEASKLGGTERVLRIAFLGDDRVAGKLENGTPWPAHLDFAGASTPPAHDGIDKPSDWLKYAGLSDIKLPARLTYFSDYSNPRPGSSDLYFTVSPDQSNAP